ncbi:MAG: winged helix-turn-helix transcriptional regulator [Clostridia bacterium]|nr:winged helix-turn-helix transcriptional regulator [Clostridia bacterium]
MNLLDLHHKNCISVFDAIQNNCRTASSIIEKTGLASGTVSQILNELIAQGLIISESKPNLRNAYFQYSINSDVYIIYIEKRGKYFHFIYISPYGEAIKDFKFPIEYNYLNPSYSLEYIIKVLKKDDEYINCKGIYISDINLEDVTIFDHDIKIIDTFNMLLEQFSNDSEINFIEYNDKKVLILYSHIHFTEAKYSDISKILKIDNHIVFDENKKYDFIFNSLTCISSNSVKNDIYNISKK